MKGRFLGFDHVDTRVRSVALVEAFYHALMPLLGMPTKTYAYVDGVGDWHDPDDAHAYKAIEYHEQVTSGELARFIGFIEDSATQPVLTRIAFAVASREAVTQWVAQLPHLGARNVELSEDLQRTRQYFSKIPPARSSSYVRVT